MLAGVLKETVPGERRVALVPAGLAALQKLGVSVAVQSGAGIEAGFPDAAYGEKGARIVHDRAALLSDADLVLQVRSLGAPRFAPAPDLSGLRRGQTVVGFFDAVAAPEGVRAIAERGVTAFALELIPRITRAQAMDALSSMATVIGYKAVLEAAGRLPRMFPLLMTAGGTLAPARVFVIGAGVAGLQAIATARRLGGVVDAYDVRPAVKEQVQSLGAKFVELPLETADTQDAGGYAKAQDESFYRRQRETMARVVAASDVVIATAAVPGQKAPLLITADMVASMRPGSVVMDAAAEQGGNCELSRPGEEVVHGGVMVVGLLNPAATVPAHASQMYARNLTNFLALLVKDGQIRIDESDPIVKETLVARGGEVTSARLREALGLPALAAQ
jgi:NAD(P) transhydrogenase subunit alpha